MASKELYDLKRSLGLLDYEFPGTAGEYELHQYGEGDWDKHIFNIKHHGYIAAFNSINNCIDWVKENEG